MNLFNAPRWKQVLALAWPLIIANSFWNLQLTIDRIFLGQYSTEALGAAMAVMGVFWVPMALLQQTAHYVTTFVAQFYGSKQFEKIGAAFWQAVYVSIIGGILFLALQWASDPFFKLMGHSPSLQALEVTYFDALTYSALPMALVAAISGFFTGLGRTQLVIGINFVGLLFNAFFDYILIEGRLGFPGLGIQGAGYATALATYCGALFGIGLLMRADISKPYALWRNIQLNTKMMFSFLKYGIPSGFQWALEGIAFTVFLVLMGHFQNGEAALASSSIAVTVMLLSILPSMGVAQAVMTLVGQKLGEKKPDLAAQYTWDGVSLSAIYMVIAAISFWVIPDLYVGLFAQSSSSELWSDVARLTPTLLAIVGVFTILDSVYLNISFALKGAGDTRFVSIIALLVPWPIMVLPTYLLRNHPDAVVLSWLCLIAYSVALVVILSIRFRQGQWKQMSVVKDL
jgi:MATE family multidrug resistance protein